jgi:hypothetical protein
VAVGNSGEREAAEALEQQTAPTCDDPVVKDHVTWAVGKLRG